MIQILHTGTYYRWVVYLQLIRIENASYIDYKNYSPIGVACNSTQRETVLICVLCTGAA